MRNWQPTLRSSNHRFERDSLRRRFAPPPLAPQAGRYVPKMLKVAISLTLALLLWSCSDTTAPRDAVLLENFRQHQPDFSMLVHMIREDRKLQHLWENSITPGDVIDEKRWNEYRKLMSRVGVRSIHANLGSDFAVTLRSRGSGSLFYDKGYEYSERKLEPRKESLDLKRSQVPPYARYYRHIDDNWYLFYANLSDF